MKAPEQLIEKACAKNDCRTYLNQPYFDGKRILACDGKILAVLKAENVDEDTKGFVPLAALKVARKGKHIQEMRLTDKAEVLADHITMPREDMDAGVMGRPSALAQVVKGARKGRVCKISLDAELLLNLAKALGSGAYKTSVTLHIGAPDQAILVTNHTRGAYGVIMPTRM